MALPKELTNILVDNNYSMNDAAAIEALIRSGKISTQQVSDYFKIPVNDINRVLRDEFGYSTDNLSDALMGKSIKNVGADFTSATTQTRNVPYYSPTPQNVTDSVNRPRGIVEQDLRTQRANEFPTGDGVISPRERELISTGGYQALPDGSIINSAGMRYNADLATNSLKPVANPAFEGIPREGFTQQQADQVAEAIRSGKASIYDARSYFKIPLEDIENTLRQNYGFTPEQIQSSRLIRPEGLIEGSNRFAQTNLSGASQSDTLGNIASQTTSNVNLPSNYRTKGDGVISPEEQRSIDAGYWKAQPDGSVITSAGFRVDWDPKLMRYVGIENPVFAGIPKEGFTKEQADRVVQGIREGKVGTEEVFRHFDIPRERINTLLQQDYGFTPEQITSSKFARPEGYNPETKLFGDKTFADSDLGRAQAQVDAASPTPAGNAANVLGGIAVDNDYSMEDARFVENAIRNGQVTIQEVSDYFGIPTTDINRVLSTDFAYTPDQISSFGGGTYTGSDQIPTGLRGSEQALREGATGAISMLDSLNRASRQDLQAGYGGGLESLGTAYQAAREFLTPYQTGGQGAFQRQQALTGALGQEAFDEAYQQSPYMRFLQEQGERSVLRNAAATGGLGGGNVQKELTRFGQGLASQGLQQDITNMAGLANIGQQSAGSLANLEMGLGQRQQQSQQGLAGLLSGATSMYGMPVANQLSSLGVNLATGRTTAGQQLADQYGQAARALGNIYAGQGQNIQSAIGGQLGTTLDLTGAAARNEALAQQNYGANIANLQSGIGSNIAGVPNAMINVPDYQTAVANALNAGQLGYDIGQQAFGNQQNQSTGRMNIGGYFPAGYFNQPTGQNPLAGVNAYQGAPQLNASGQLTAMG